MDILGDKFKPQPYWWDDIDFGAQKTTDSPEIPSKTDVLIVGAGYAGLHAAIVLAYSFTMKRKLPFFSMQ